MLPPISPMHIVIKSTPPNIVEFYNGDTSEKIAFIMETPLQYDLNTRTGLGYFETSRISKARSTLKNAILSMLGTILDEESHHAAAHSNN